MELTNPLPFVVQLNDADSPADAIDAMLLGGFVAGTFPASRSLSLQGVRADARLLPEGVAPIREAREAGRHARLAVGDGWVLRTLRWSNGTALLTAIAVSDELAEAVIDQAVIDAVEPPEPEDEAARIVFWHLARGGASSATRSIAIEPWSAIRRNYAEVVAGAFDRVMQLDPDGLSGRLLLLHGPPGTGKTTALRALAHAWRAWCDLEYVLDPDQLLRNPAYLTRVLLDHEGADDAGTPRWRLLVLEDCDELIRADAKQGAGQALGRLLNLTDGLVGQGLAVLVCITTNEELSSLHPAVVRPGRCVAQIHVGRLPRGEAIAWLGADGGIAAEGATLAELCARRNGREHIRETEPAHPAGLYL